MPILSINKEKQLEHINENIKIYHKLYLENNSKEMDLKARMLDLNNKLQQQVPLDTKLNLFSKIKKEYSEMIQKGYFSFLF